jgi:hypothetical protein
MLGPLTVGAISQAFGLVTGFEACGAMGPAAIGLVVRRQPGGGPASA